MPPHIHGNWLRRAALLGALALGLTQVGCAHPVAVEPSVVISSRMGHVPVYAQIGLPASVWVMPPPSVYYAPPPRVVYAPSWYAPVPGWGRGHGHHPHGRRHGHADHGERSGWRR